MWPFGKSTADRVKEAFDAQPVLQPLGLQVQERGGTVTVSGSVPKERLVNLVRIVAEGINGVRNVDVSGITVQQATPASAPAQAAPEAPAPVVTVENDPVEEQIRAAEDASKIAKAVHSAIRGNGELADDPIDVLQSGKSVILRGVVDSDHELRLAEQIARGVEGVAAVDVSGLKVAAGAKELVKEKDQDTGDTVYTVKAGDTLSEIAQRYYGDPMQYKKIAHYNNMSNPDLIQPGQKIRIPG